MSDRLEDDGRGIGAAAVFAVAALLVIIVAVLYNSLARQAGSSRAAMPAALVAVEADPGPGKTVHLKYDQLTEDVQRQLLAAGFYKGPVDGVTGTRTREAIAAYQQATGVAATGEATPGLAEQIRTSREIAEATLFTGSTEADAGAEPRAAIRRVQTGLAELAYSPGPIDGLMKAATRAAIAAFERDRGLAATGQISPALLAELAKLSGQSEMTPN